MTTTRIRHLFGTGWLALALALPWAAATLPESRTNVRPDMCSIDEGRKADPQLGAAAVWSRTTALLPPPAGMCSLEPAKDPPPADLPEVERPATVQNLRRVDRP